MDKFLIRKDVYDELIEKGYGKKDLSKLTKKKITDKNGHTRTVYVRNGEQPAAQNQPKAQEELTPEKKARYEEMLEKVKAGPDENALFVSSKGMLNKKDAIAHLEAKLGKKPMNSAYQGHLESENPPNTDITKEDEERFGKQALSGLSGKRTGSGEVDFKKWLEDNDIVPEEMAGESHAQIYKKVRKTGLDDDAAMKITNDIMAYNEAYKSEEPKEANTQKASDVLSSINFDIIPTTDTYIRVDGEGDIGVISKRNTKDFNENTLKNAIEKIGDKKVKSYSVEPNDFNSTVIKIKLDKDENKNKSSVNGFKLDDIYHHGSDKKWSDVKKIDDMETAKGVVEMIAQKYGATDKGREQLMDFIAYNIGGTNPLYDKLYEEYGIDADDLDMDFEASHDLILNQAMGKDTKKNREQIADSKADFETRYRQMLEREG